jgi:mannose-6-phosphate isomerase
MRVEERQRVRSSLCSLLHSLIAPLALNMSSTSSSSPLVVQLDCAVQQYEWGKVGKSSLVYQLKSAQLPSDAAALDSDAPFSELWMGTHPNGPTCIRQNDSSASMTLLSSWLQQQGIECELPYLFKVLSIAKPLSIQAHPDQALAQQLHRSQPSVYRDPNHKPEIACAITAFEALSGFRPMNEIAQHVCDVPELASLLQHNTVHALLQWCGRQQQQHESDHVKALLKQVLAQLLATPAERVAEAIAQFQQRFNDEQQSAPSYQAQCVSLRLNQHFPNDIGVFVALLLNYVQLQPGQAFFMGPNEPHAYLSGDCIEAMACSDNVVRAGLTPKLKDAETLCKMLTYQTRHPDIMHGQVFAVDGGSRSVLYAPDAVEFSVMRSVVAPSTGSYSLPVSSYSTILLVIDSASDGVELAVHADDRAQHTVATIGRGQVWFIGAGVRVSVCNASEQEPVDVYACTTGSGFQV